MTAIRATPRRLATIITFFKERVFRIEVGTHITIATGSLNTCSQAAVVIVDITVVTDFVLRADKTVTTEIYTPSTFTQRVAFTHAITGLIAISTCIGESVVTHFKIGLDDAIAAQVVFSAVGTTSIKGIVSVTVIALLAVEGIDIAIPTGGPGNFRTVASAL